MARVIPTGPAPTINTSRGDIWVIGKDSFAFQLLFKNHQDAEARQHASHARGEPRLFPLCPRLPFPSVTRGSSKPCLDAAPDVAPELCLWRGWRAGVLLAWPSCVSKV